MRNTATRRTLLGATALALSGRALAADARSGGGRQAPPQAALDRAMFDGTTGLLVIEAGQVRAERYAPGWTADRPREVASVAKSIVAILIGMAIEDGFIAGIDQQAADFIPAWRGTPRQAITLRHLMSMTSGLDDAGLGLRDISGDQFAINAAAPLRDPPGTRWAYNTAAYHLLFHVLARAAEEPVKTYAARRLTGPLSMTHTSWITGRGQGDLGPVTNYYSANSTARDLARIGGLVLNEGLWAGRRLVSADFIRALTAPSQVLNPSYGLLWWCNSSPGFDAGGKGEGLRFPHAPRDAVAALGTGSQAILVVPSRKLVIVRQGDAPRAPDLLDRLLSTLAGPGGPA